MQKLLPRHLELIYEINYYWLEKVKAKYPENVVKLRNLSCIEEVPVKKIRMASLCIIGSQIVNGVASIHSKILMQYILLLT